MHLRRGRHVARLHAGGAAPRGPALTRPGSAPRRALAAAALAAATLLSQTPAVGTANAAPALLTDGAAAGGRAIVVGERGHVLLSDDAGATWTRARVPVRALLTAVHMHDARLGWAVGHDAAVLRTDDGGATWRLVHHAPEMHLPLLDVWFRDAEAGFAVGAFGLFLASADGGESWTCRNGCDEAEEPPLLLTPGNDWADDFHLNAIAPAGGGRVYLAGEAGALYRSDDDGATWRALSSPYHGSWFAALATDADTVLVAGLRGHLFRTADAGLSWAQVATGTTATLAGAARSEAGAIVVAGLAGAVFVSRDGGHSVEARSLPTRQGLSGALAVPGGGVVLLGESGVSPLPGVE